MKTSWIEEIKTNSIFRIDENVRMASIALSKIDSAEIWVRQNQALNPLGNQLLHICGNMTQYIISGLGNSNDTRDRDKEFSTEEGFTLDELLNKLLLTTQAASKVIQEVTEEQLLAMYTVQGFDYSGIGLLIHVVEHFSYHTGQIAFQVKLAINEPLGFYAGIDLNTINESQEEKTAAINAKEAGDDKI